MSIGRSTPGSWDISLDEAGCYVIGSATDDVATVNCHISIPHETWAANAALIAAAPDLLEALVEVYFLARTDSPEMWGRVQKAIKKAASIDVFNASRDDFARSEPTE